MTEGEPERNLADEPREWASRYTKSKLQAPLHCTASDDGPCHVVEDLEAWNEFLCHAQLELRECRPGKRCLTPLDHGQYQCSSRRRRRKAFILVYWLLARHRCLVDAHLVASPGFHEHDAIISSGLRSASALKALRIDSMSQESRLLPQGTPSLTSLEELYCDVRDPPLGLLESICSILESSQSLKTVALPNLRMSSLEAGILWDALSRGSTFSALFISSTALLPTNGYQMEAISKFVETAATLNPLGISSSGYCTREELASVVRYLRRPEVSLSSISLRSFSVDDEDGKEIRLLLTEKDALRIFKMEDCRWYGVRSGLAGFPRYDTDDFGSLTQRILPWLIILQRNCTLEELQLKLEGFCPAECVAFFQALSSNANLTKVTIEDIHAYFSARGRRIGTIDPSLHDYATTFSECVRWCKFRLSLFHASDMDWFTASIQRLQSLDTITSLELDIGLLMQDEFVGSLVGEYIETTTSLKEFTLNFRLSATLLTSGGSVCKLAILSALSRNASLRRSCVKLPKLHEPEVQLLASAVKSSGSMCSFTLDTSGESTDSFVKCILPGFSRNFSLVSLHFRPGVSRLSREWFHVRNVVRRNYCLVTRAAHFAAGRNRSRHCAQALEPVASSTALVAKVSDMASVSEGEAVEMIRENLRSLQSRLGYLRAAGVIRNTLALHARPDQRPQLDSLDDKSWLYLRRYLYVGDVLSRTS